MSRPVGTSASRRPPLAARRLGYAIGALCGVLLLIAVNGWPGWDVVGFLTPDMDRVVGLINLSLGVGLAVNLSYLAYDEGWWRRLGDAVVAAVGLVALVRLLRVYPFDLGPTASALVRVLLVVAIVGTAIGILAGVGAAVRLLARAGTDR